MKKKRRVARKDACVFLKETDSKGLPKCACACWHICSKKFAIKQCEIFPRLMEKERKDFERRRVVWNRGTDGAPGLYHETLL